MKALSKARDAEERRAQERRRAAIVLIMRHLCDHGYTETYERLCSESSTSLARMDAADNIDVLTIIQEFEESFEQKYGKKPKLVRRLVEEVRYYCGRTTENVIAQVQPGQYAYS